MIEAEEMNFVLKWGHIVQEFAFVLKGVSLDQSEVSLQMCFINCCEIKFKCDYMLVSYHRTDFLNQIIETFN